ncbi:hypothetical protein H0H93_011054 [Arthromyces matolae]|nr:hypothetical protein H0H93_011054 [Arthromyces matolae]
MRPFGTLNGRNKSILGLSIFTVVTGSVLYSQTRRVILADAEEEEDLRVHKLPRGETMTRTALYGRNISGEPLSVIPSHDIDAAIVNAKLRQLSAIWSFPAEARDSSVGIRRFDSIAIPSSIPSLEFSTITSTSSEIANGSSWTIFLHHEGLQHGFLTAEYVAQTLHPAIVGGLYRVFLKYRHLPEHNEIATITAHGPEENITEDTFERVIHQELKERFIDVDQSIVQHPFEPNSLPKHLAIAAVGPALTGSSALMAFYDHQPRKLRIANTGNVRAVLGRVAGSGNDGEKSYSVHVLSEDHTSDLGPGLSRAFGLGPYKWNSDTQDRIYKDFMGDRPLTPKSEPVPIITAEPSVTTVDVKSGDFLVLATSGLWRSLTDEEVVGLVGLWLNKDMISEGKMEGNFSLTNRDVILPSDLPTPVSSDKIDKTVMYERWGLKKRFLCVDTNAAWHLARNALGGADVAWTATILALQPPRSLKLR